MKHRGLSFALSIGKPSKKFWLEDIQKTHIRFLILFFAISIYFFDLDSLFSSVLKELEQSRKDKVN